MKIVEENAVKQFSDKLLVAIGEYENETEYSDEDMEYTKLRTLVDVQNIIQDVCLQYNPTKQETKKSKKENVKFWIKTFLTDICIVFAGMLLWQVIHIGG